MSSRMAPVPGSRDSQSRAIPKPISALPPMPITWLKPTPFGSAQSSTARHSAADCEMSDILPGCGCRCAVEALRPSAGTMMPKDEGPKGKLLRLIERTNDASKGALGHKEAVDIGFAAATAPYVMSFHTDTIPLREDWLSWHVEQLTAEPNIAAVGTYKLELKSPLWRRLRDWSDRLLSWRQAPTKHGDHRPYIRSHCALYRREVLEELGLHYNASLTETAGRDVHFGLEQNGYRANLLSVEETMLRVAHLNHATMVLVSEFGIRGRTARRGRSRIERFFERPDVRAVYDDETLDKLEAQSRAA